MTTTHTPGPWHVGLGTVNPDWVEGILMEVILGPGDEVVAVTGDCEANSMLIAAAPELLKALRDLVLRCDGAEGVREDGSNICTRGAHAVLALVDPEFQAGSCAHDWNYTGTAYGGDDDRYHGEGRVICRLCGEDGDA